MTQKEIIAVIKEMRSFCANQRFCGDCSLKVFCENRLDELRNNDINYISDKIKRWSERK